MNRHDDFLYDRSIFPKDKTHRGKDAIYLRNFVIASRYAFEKITMFQLSRAWRPGLFVPTSVGRSPIMLSTYRQVFLTDSDSSYIYIINEYYRYLVIKFISVVNILFMYY